MPDLNTYKLDGAKIVPLNRFNLEEGKLSTNFTTIKEDKNPSFTVIAHPILTSIVLQPIIINTILNKEYFPLIENNSLIDQKTLFYDYNDNTLQLQFPDIEISPLNSNQVFYYENVLNEKSENTGLLGKVTLNYNVKNKVANQKLQNIPIQLKEVILNLKVKDNIIRINGIVDDVKKEIIFSIKDEAVKIAFSNLVTNIEELKSNIDLFFSFKGYTKLRKNFLLAKDVMFQRINLSETIKMESVANKRVAAFNRPMIISDKIDAIRPTSVLEAQDIKPEYVKSTFILKINKTVNYPLQSDISKSLYQTIGGGFINNPFNFNEDFSLYEQIFVPGINLDKLSIYKSKLTPNEFLLISKRYNITRSTDTKMPCVNTIFHGTEDGTGLSNDISKISFQFAIGPDLSEFELNRIKIELYNNKFLDGDTTDYFDKIKFVYPNDIEAKYEINGNQYFQNANISIDGKYFLVDFSTENLNDASILINSINNSLSQYANINFIHKEIKDTSIIEFNIQKTIGEIISLEIDGSTKKIAFKNNSLSTCKVLSALTIDNVYQPLFSSTPFVNYSIESDQKKEILFSALNANLSNKELQKVFLDYDIIENINKEFSNIVATSSNFNRYIQIQFQTQKTTTARIRVELLINATGASFTLERLKADFKNPLLINFLLNNSAILNTSINFTSTYFDKDNNLVSTFSDVYDFSISTILTIPKK
ncbi:hypothetical protein [Flavobacterium sp.]|uniref:hypothetical protein n=1 Tax=Flavobacterium sp. TaxID=239 RepID=UPI0038FC3E80